MSEAVALFFFLLVLVAAGVSAVLAYLSVKNLMQGLALNNPLPLAKLKSKLDRLVAVHGTTALTREPALKPFRFPVIWYQRIVQEWRSHGRGGSWVTVSRKERANDFELRFPDGGRMVVTARPTEVQGANRKVNRRGLTSRRRAIQRWLAEGRPLTILGTLRLSKRGITILPHSRLGLLFSSRSPRRAARVEFLKAAGGFAGILAMAIGLVVLLLYMQS